MEDRRRHHLGWYSYDPALNLLYYGTGNPSTWNPAQRPGDNRWSMSIWARDVDSGKVKWVYQMTPYDEWDFDGINEMVLADISVKGQDRKVLVHFDRNGFGYTLDRVTGELLVAQKYDPSVNWATKVDMTTGRPQVVSKYSTAQNGPEVDTKGVCPAALGSNDQLGGWAGIGMAAGLEKDNDGLGAVGGYKELKDYTDLGGVLTVFTLSN